MKKVMVILVVIGLVCYSSSIAGRPGAVKVPKPKSPGKASLISLAGTLAPYGIAYTATRSNNGRLGTTAGILIVAGSIVGPGLGHSYAGNNKRVWNGIGIRTAGLLVSAIGFGATFNASWNHGKDSPAGSLLIVIGGLFFWGSSIYDIATADD